MWSPCLCLGPRGQDISFSPPSYWGGGMRGWQDGHLAAYKDQPTTGTMIQITLRKGKIFFIFLQWWK